MVQVGQDAESAEWVRALSGGGEDREAAIRRLHQRLLAVAHHEARRRSGASPVRGLELDDLACQAADDAVLAVLAKLPTFRGDSRFSTWAYRFVVLELSHKIGRHYWRHTAPTDAHAWDQLPGAFGLEPSHQAEAAALITAVRATVVRSLTPRQRDVFVAAVVDGVPLDALAERLGVTRGAVYKVLYDARQALRAGLVADGYLDAVPAPRRVRRTAGTKVRARLDGFLRTDPADVGCDEALELLHIYVELVRADHRSAESRYPGIVAHLAECGPCGDDFTGLLTAVSGKHPDTADGISRPRVLRRRPRSGR